METYSIVRLFRDDLYNIVDHIVALSVDDRYLRFCYNISNDQIMKYVEKTTSTVNTKELADFWFGVKLDDKLVATIHISIDGRSAEFAFTTDIDHRGKKLGQLLFARGYQLVTEYNIYTIYMQCLTQNQAMRHIAKKFGLSVISHGPDLEASINIDYPVPFARIDEVKMSIVDKGLNSIVKF